MTGEGLGALKGGLVDYNELLVGGISDFIKRQEEERQYIEDIAKKIGEKKDTNYINAQHVVIALHLEVDKAITEFIGILLDYGVENFKDKKFMYDSITDEAVAKLPVGSRLNIIAALRYFTSDSMRFMTELNRIRNNFAHPKQQKEGQFLYRNTLIFTRKGIDYIKADYDIFNRERYTFIDKFIKYLKAEKDKL